MAVLVGQTEPARCVALEIELDHYSRLTANYPAIMAGIDDDYLGRRELHNAPIGILNVDLAASQKSYMRVHAIIEAYNGLHMSGPTESGLVNRPLHAGSAGADDVERDSADFPVLGILHRGEQLIGAFHRSIPSDCIRNQEGRRRLQPGAQRLSPSIQRLLADKSYIPRVWSLALR